MQFAVTLLRSFTLGARFRVEECVCGETERERSPPESERVKERVCVCERVLENKRNALCMMQFCGSLSARLEP